MTGYLAHPNYTNRVDPLNLLRVYATMLVFIAHTNIFSNGLVWLGKSVFYFNTPAWAAMWVFYTLSGFLAGKSFASKRYTFTPSHIGKYYYKKILRIWLPTMLFIFITCILVYPDFLPTYPFVIKNFFLCIYGSTWNNPAVDGIGATWFVFTLMWLYISAPLVSFFANMIKKAKRLEERPALKTLCYLFAILLCLFVGEVWRQYVKFAELDWFHYVYTPPYANISIFAAGVFFAFLLEDKRREKRREEIEKRTVGIWIKVVASIGLCGIMLLFSYMFYAYGVAGQTDGFWGSFYSFYQYSAPGTVCILTLLYIYAFQQNGMTHYSSPTLAAIMRNPFRLIDAFSMISFEFYLMHSLVLSRICNYLRRDSQIQEWLLIAIIAFLISVFFAYLFSLAIEKFYAVCHLHHMLAWAKEYKYQAVFLSLLLVIVVGTIYLVIILPI